MEDTEKFERIAGSIHAHTSFSGGNLTPEEVVALAREKGIKILAVTDYSDRKWEYHKISINRASVLKFGMRRYLDEVASVAGKNPGIVILCGLETSPFYCWEGNFLRPVCRDYNKHIIVLGLKELNDFKNLPLLANKNSGYDQYSGSHGIEPYQKLIDYVNLKGGLTFWAHPEMEDNFRYFNARAYTPAYAEDLRKSFNYTGFSVFPRGEKMAEPGGYWDEILCDYCKGRRGKPVWAIAETDYRRENDDICNPATIFISAAGDKEDVLDALRNGKVYVLESSSGSLYLDRFSIVDEETNRCVSLGESLLTKNGALRIFINIDSSIPLSKVSLMKNGTVISETTVCDFEYIDNNPFPPEYSKIFYRLGVENIKGNKLLTNPIFVEKV